MRAKIVSVFAAILLTATGFGQTIWTTDKYHSQLHFSVVHFGISNIEGAFREFNVTMVSEKEDFSDARVEMVAKVAAGYYTDGLTPDAADLARPLGRTLTE